MAQLIFILGTLLGILISGALCIRYLRREIPADIGPQLRQTQAQLDSIKAIPQLRTAESVRRTQRRARLVCLYHRHYGLATTNSATALRGSGRNEDQG
jgi:hypothetical protein